MKMNIGKLLMLSTICLIVIFFAGLSLAWAEAKVVLRAADCMPVNYSYHVAFEAWAEKVAEDSNGQIQIDIFSAGQLGDERELIEGLQMGAIDFAITSIAPLSCFTPKLNVLNLPYLFKDVEHTYRVLDGIPGKAFSTYVKNEKKGFLVLAWLSGGGRSFYTKKPVHSVKDLSGLKIRVMENELYINMVDLLGAKATPLAYSEVYTALQQGVIDGAENDPGSYLTTKHYEVCPNYSLDYHTIDVSPLLVSEKNWNKLPESVREVLLNALPVFLDKGRKYWAKQTTDAITELKKLGVNVIEVDKEEFMEAVKPLWKQAEQEYGSEFFDLIGATE